MTHYHGGTDWQEGGGPEPSEHLPECAEYHPSGDGFDLCICDRLRACEQRVDAEWDSTWTRMEDHYKSGYEDGVQAARDAVAALPIKSSGVSMATDALAAIDGLRGES